MSADLGGNAAIVTGAGPGRFSPRCGERRGIPSVRRAEFITGQILFVDGGLSAKVAIRRPDLDKH